MQVTAKSFLISKKHINIGIVKRHQMKATKLSDKNERLGISSFNRGVIMSGRPWMDSIIRVSRV